MWKLERDESSGVYAVQLPNSASQKSRRSNSIAVSSLFQTSSISTTKPDPQDGSGTVCSISGRKLVKGSLVLEVPTGCEGKGAVAIADLQEVVRLIQPALTEPGAPSVDALAKQLKGMEKLSVSQRAKASKLFTAHAAKEQIEVLAPQGGSPNATRKRMRSAQGVEKPEEAVPTPPPAPVHAPDASKADEVVPPSKAPRASTAASPAGPALEAPPAEAPQPAKAHASKAPKVPQLSEYELERLERIRQNRERMMGLGLDTALAVVKAAQEVKKLPVVKGISAKRTKAVPEIVERRQSARVRGVQVDPALGAGVDYETSKGVVLKAAFVEVAEAAGAKPGNKVLGGKTSASGGSTHPVGPIEFVSDNAGPRGDAHLLKQLRLQTPADVGTAVGGRTGEGCSPPAKLAGTVLRCETAKGLELREGDVAKVTKDGITHLAFHPGGRQLLLAAGDKTGKLGLWQVDANPEDVPHDENDDLGPYDGVLTCTPHYKYISGVKWTSQGATLATCSYDRSIRIFDVSRGVFDEVRGLAESLEISAMDITSNGHVAYIGDNMGNMEVHDLRAHKALVAGFSMQEKRINTVHIEPGEESLLVTSCGDSLVRIWDMRQLSTRSKSGGKGGANPVASLAHGKSCQSAYFAPDGSRMLLTTSYDDTIAITAMPTALTSSTHQLLPSFCFKHNNQTGRWVIPFRAVWGPAADCAFVGGMNRTLDVLSVPGLDDLPLAKRKGGDASASCAYADKEATTSLSCPELMTAIPSRSACHPTLSVVAAATSSGRVHIWR